MPAHSQLRIEATVSDTDVDAERSKVSVLVMTDAALKWCSGFGPRRWTLKRWR